MNTKISAEIIADSITPYGENLTTMRITFPRYILAELNTHRMLSKNSASSRAIPFEKMVKAVEENPFIPIAWQKDHKGMQGTEYLIDRKHENAVYEWLKARDYAVKQARMMNNDGVTKQLCNRLLEPFMWNTVLVTATDWENFFALRCPQYQTPVSRTVEPQRSWKDLLAVHSNPINAELLIENKDNWTFKMQHSLSGAEIHIQALAEAIWDALKESTPKKLKEGEWHIPFGDNITNKELSENLYHLGGSNDQLRVKIATARCARVSYTVIGEEEKKSNYQNDIKLHDRLASMGHWSPFEHCARVMDDMERAYYYTSTGPTPDKFHTGVLGNFRGFIQYRKMFENENIL